MMAAKDLAKTRGNDKRIRPRRDHVDLPRPLHPGARIPIPDKDSAVRKFVFGEVRVMSEVCVERSENDLAVGRSCLHVTEKQRKIGRERIEFLPDGSFAAAPPAEPVEVHGGGRAEKREQYKNPDGWPAKAVR